MKIRISLILAITLAGSTALASEDSAVWTLNTPMKIGQSTYNTMAADIRFGERFISLTGSMTGDTPSANMQFTGSCQVMNDINVHCALSFFNYDGHFSVNPSTLNGYLLVNNPMFGEVVTATSLLTYTGQ